MPVSIRRAARSPLPVPEPRSPRDRAVGRCRAGPSPRLLPLRIPSLPAPEATRRGWSGRDGGDSGRQTATSRPVARKRGPASPGRGESPMPPDSPTVPAAVDNCPASHQGIGWRAARWTRSPGRSRGGRSPAPRDRSRYPAPGSPSTPLLRQSVSPPRRRIRRKCRCRCSRSARPVARAAPTQFPTRCQLPPPALAGSAPPANRPVVPPLRRQATGLKPWPSVP